MRTIEPRDVLATVVFGAPSAWLWASLIGLLSAYTQFPLLVALSKEFGEHLKPWVPTFMFAWELLGSAMCAFIIALPLGYLLRGRVVPMAILFSLLFLSGLAISDFMQDEPSLFAFVLSFSGPWLFLAWSAAFIFFGHSLRKRKHVDLTTGSRRRRR